MEENFQWDISFTENFSIWSLRIATQCYYIVGNPSFIKGSDFRHKKGGVGKIEGSFKKGGLLLIFILTLSSVIFLWVFDECVCVFCLLTPVLFEETSLTASNQQTYDLHKWIIVGKRRHHGK